VKDSKVSLPQREATKTTKIEKIGYKVANGMHKVGVFTLVSFIVANLFWFGKEYNDYWKARRVILYINNKQLESRSCLRHGKT
jgi:hypothetical protein